jgi:hypothetical protein
MLILNVALFGAIGLAVWAVQMAWIPIMAAGHQRHRPLLGLPQLRGCGRQHQREPLGHHHRR